MEDVIIAILKGFRSRLILYFSIGSALSFVIYVLFRGKQINYKIQSLSHRWSDVKREIKYSLSSLFIFSALAYFLFWLIQNDFTLLYTGQESRGILYYVVSIFLAVAVHDAYFYFTHRMLHTRWFMRNVHKIHHESHDPTLWAAFSFHPVEAIINFGVFFVLICCLPLHRSVLFYFFLLNTGNNILGHCGYEVFPANFTKHWLGKWFTTSTHHNIHHRYARGNYGLYFTWLDRTLGTEHPHYHDTFENVVLRRNDD